MRNNTHFVSTIPKTPLHYQYTLVISADKTKNKNVILRAPKHLDDKFSFFPCELVTVGNIFILGVVINEQRFNVLESHFPQNTNQSCSCFICIKFVKAPF